MAHCMPLSALNLGHEVNQKPDYSLIPNPWHLTVLLFLIKKKKHHVQMYDIYMVNISKRHTN